VSAGGLGDTVLFSLVLPHFMEMAHAGEQVTVLLRSDAAKMAFLLPSTVTLKAVDFSRFRKSLSYRRKVCGDLYRKNYRLVISTDHLRHPDLDEALIAAAAAAETAAMEPRSWPKHDAALKLCRTLYSRLFDSGPDRTDKVLRWTHFANWLSGEQRPAPKVHIANISKAPPSTDIYIQPFSAVKGKQPSPGFFRDVITALPEGTTVAITGSPGDMDRCPDYRELLTLPGVSFDSSGFVDLAPKLKAARLVISVDTALMHLAAATGAPTLCLASAAYVGEIVPYTPEVAPENVRFIYKSMDCEGCLGACIHPPENGMYRCVAGIDKDATIKAVLDMLDN